MMRCRISVCLLSMCLCAVPTARAATIVVLAGGDLQAALNAAQPGDVITLAPNATYTGNFVLPNKGAVNDYITIRSAAPDASLPPAGVRMTPAYADLLPKIKSGNSMSALQTATAANHWRLMFLEFQANKDGYGDIIALGVGDSTQTQLSQVPYALVLDRLYIHGDPVAGQKRGIALHSSDTTVINSWVSDCKAVSQEAQAISGFNGPGNYLIENNYLEGATQSFLLGGADPKIPNLVTTTVTFRSNHLRKPLAWRDPIIATPQGVTAVAAAGAGSLAAGTYYYKVQARVPAGQTNQASSTASVEVSATIAAGTTGGVTISWTPVAGAQDYVVYGRAAGAENINWKTTNPYFTDTGAAGTTGSPASAAKWMVKNIFELKNAQDVVVEGNVFENNWVAAQPGYAIVFTPRNQSGTAPWVAVQRVTFRHNIVRHTAGGVNILGTDNLAPSQQTNHIVMRDNLFDDLTSASWGSGSRPFQIGAGADTVTIDHNTVVTTDSTILWLYGAPSTSTVYTNNMSAHNTYGIFGSGSSSGIASINMYLPGGVVAGNVLAGGSASKYPAGNFFPTVSAWQSNFVNYAAGDYRLTAVSAYNSAGTDGKNLGADIDAVNAQTANALTGDNRTAPGMPHLQILPTGLPNGVFGQPYAAPLSCVGATGSCGWRVLNSSLPAGVTVDTVAGLIYGTPSAVETGVVTIEAYDTAFSTNAATATLTLTVDAPPFVMTMPAAKDGQVGVAYQLFPAVTGAIGSVTWSVASGTLPGGVGVDGLSGAITGTPSTWGTTSAVVQAQDSWGTNRTDAKTFTVTVAPSPIAVTTTALANGLYQTAYQASLGTSGGTGAVTWSSVGTLPAGVSLDPNGTINGTPTSIGTFTFDVTAQDANWPGNRATKTLSLTIDAPVFSVAIPQSPDASVGRSYQLTATASGNVGSVSWSIASGVLPAGLVFNAATGTISGVPTAWGTFTVVVQGTDSWGSNRSDAKPLTISVAPVTLVITTTALPHATYQTAYQATLTATGGTGALVWSALSALPAGLTLSPSGVINWTPGTVETVSLTVRASDANWVSSTDTKTLTLVVDPPILTVSVPSASTGGVGVVYQMAASSAGQVGAVAWSISAGALPPGVTINPATGVISGVPTSSGSFTATVQAQDSWNARVASATTTITIAPQPIAIATATLAAASVRQAYQATLQATGGTGLTTWTVAGGSLPAGLTLAANGVITGTPTAAGSFSFTVQAADAGWPGNVATRALSITVGAREIVLYASDASKIAGTWSLVADAAAAGGSRIWNQDKAAAKITTPIANPVNYFEITFQAEAGVPYHLWVRGKADASAWANDSVYVQYSGSLDATGAAAYRIGTTSARTVSIEQGTNAGLSGWGWSDDAWDALADSITFATSGTQTIRVQVREDGLSIDQIVLSAGTYQMTAPGAAKNDTTILSR
jgi:putative Ig domain-containing protein